MRFQIAIVSSALAISAMCGCGDSADRFGPSGARRPLTRATARTSRFADLDDQLAAIAAREPRFGGLYRDRGQLIVVATDTTAAVAALRSAVTSVLTDPRLQSEPIHVRYGKYAFSALYAWGKYLPGAFGVAGVVSTDLDEANDRLSIGITDLADSSAVSAYLTARGVPRDAVAFHLDELIATSSSLNGEFRAIGGGLRVTNTFGAGCTVGFNGIYEGDSVYATDGHCTGNIAGPDGSEFYQPNGTLADSMGGVQWESGVFSDETDARCPDTNPTCKWSDIALGLYRHGYDQALGALMRVTTRSQYDSNLVIDGASPYLFITDKELGPLVGDSVWKVGSTTGWTYGTVTSTCVTRQFVYAGTLYSLVCQDEGNFGNMHGDSGAAVFSYDASTDAVTLVGQLIGGSDSTCCPAMFRTTVFSPLNNIQFEMGTIGVTTTGQ